MIGQAHQPLGAAAGLPDLSGERGNDRHAETGRDEAADNGNVVLLERHPWSESRVRAQLVGEDPQFPGGSEHHEVLVRGLGERDLITVGEAMARRYGEVQRLVEEPFPDHVGIARPSSGELQVGAPTGHE